VPDIADQTPAQLLSQEMGITDESVARRRRIVGLEPRDSTRIASVKDMILSRSEELSAAFFDYLAGIDEGRPVIGNRAALDRARQLKREHLRAMLRAEYDLAYVEQRIELAMLYSKLGLELRVFLGAFHHLLMNMGALIMKGFERAPHEGFEAVMSLEKAATFDIGVMVDVIVFDRERVIRQQQDAIRELSTPVLQVRERLLLLPIIGVIDTHRARLVTENLLRSIRASRAKVVVMDVTGVATIDSKVANHLIQTVTAAKLMGASVIVSGLSAEVAQSLVALGIDLTKLNTVGDLQGGMEEAERYLGLRVTPAEADRSVAPPTTPAAQA
jgi:rsbT co-antagonist protein RsbR